MCCHRRHHRQGARAVRLCPTFCCFSANLLFFLLSLSLLALPSDLVGWNVSSRLYGVFSFFPALVSLSPLFVLFPFALSLLRKLCLTNTFAPRITEGSDFLFLLPFVGQGLDKMERHEEDTERNVSTDKRKTSSWGSLPLPIPAMVERCQRIDK